MLVAEVDGRLVGFLTVGPGREPGMNDHVELMSVYVHPVMHGFGVAQALATQGLLVGASYLWVLTSNCRAQAFYRKRGYRLDGATKPHPPTGSFEVRTVRT